MFKGRIAEEEGGHGRKKESEFWDELQRQLKKYRVAVKRGKMKNVVLIELAGWR